MIDFIIMDPKDKIQEISDERYVLRQEIIATEQAIQRCVFSGVAALAILAGIYWKPELLGNTITQAFILAVINQLVFGVVVYAMMNLAGINGIADYIAVLERKINLLAEDTITAWESNIVLEIIWHPRSPAFWCAMVFNLWILFIFVGSSILALNEIKNTVFIIVDVIELIIVFLLIIWTVVCRKRTRLSILKELGFVNKL